MNISIDVSGLKSSFITGIGTYIQNLLLEYRNDDAIKISGSYRISRLKHHFKIKENIFSLPCYPIIPFISPQCDVFHGIDFWIPKYGNFKKVITIHDLATFHPQIYEPSFADYFRKRYEESLLKHHPDHIIVVSEFIKNEFLERFPQFENNTSVVYHGSGHFIKQDFKTKIYNFQYIVCIGTIVDRKNITTLYFSFKKIKEKLKAIKLIFIGKKSHLNPESEKIYQEMLSDKDIVFTGFIDEQTSKNIISNALFSVFPSVYEGFGFPIIESMAMGVPVITGNFGATKEIAGDSALLCDTKNVDELAENILYLFDNENLRMKLIQKGFERIKYFSWKKSAKETLDVYQKAMKN